MQTVITRDDVEIPRQRVVELVSKLAGDLDSYEYEHMRWKEFLHTIDVKMIEMGTLDVVGAEQVEGSPDGGSWYVERGD